MTGTHPPDPVATRVAGPTAPGRAGHDGPTGRAPTAQEPTAAQRPSTALPSTAPAASGATATLGGWPAGPTPAVSGERRLPATASASETGPETGPETVAAASPEIVPAAGPAMALETPAPPPSAARPPRRGPGRDVLLARAYLSRVAEAPAPGLAALVAAVGPGEAADRVRAGAVPRQVHAETAARRGVDRAEADLAMAADVGARLLVPEHPDWPDSLAALAGCGVAELAPPVALWVRGSGRLGALCEHAVAVVGARAATSYGMHVAGEIGSGLAGQRHTVVSGAAIGIDGAAHRGALAVDGPTVAVLACGIDRSYPSGHRALLERIAAAGLVVSEYPPSGVPARHRFLVRNRLIAGLSAATVVVEAGLRSGATRTASDTAELGRPVLAVPGPVTSGMSAGCHRLIREGATLVTGTDDVLEAVSPLGARLVGPASEPPRETDGLDPVGRLVHDALPAHGSREVGWLAMEAGVPVGAVRIALVGLERRGLAELQDGRWRRPSRADR